MASLLSAETSANSSGWVRPGAFACCCPSATRGARVGVGIQHCAVATEKKHGDHRLQTCLAGGARTRATCSGRGAALCESLVTRLARSNSRQPQSAARRKQLPLHWQGLSYRSPRAPRVRACRGLTGSISQDLDGSRHCVGSSPRWPEVSKPYGTDGTKTATIISSGGGFASDSLPLVALVPTKILSMCYRLPGRSVDFGSFPAAGGASCPVGLEVRADDSELAMAAAELVGSGSTLKQLSDGACVQDGEGGRVTCTPAPPLPKRNSGAPAPVLAAHSSCRAFAPCLRALKVIARLGSGLASCGGGVP